MKRNHKKSLNLALIIAELLKWDTEKSYEVFDDQKLSFPIFASTALSM